MGEKPAGVQPFFGSGASGPCSPHHFRRQIAQQPRLPAENFQRPRGQPRVSSRRARQPVDPQAPPVHRPCAPRSISLRNSPCCCRRTGPPRWRRPLVRRSRTDWGSSAGCVPPRCSFLPPVRPNVSRSRYPSPVNGSTTRAASPTRYTRPMCPTPHPAGRARGPAGQSCATAGLSSQRKLRVRPAFEPFDERGRGAAREMFNSPPPTGHRPP